MHTVEDYVARAPPQQEHPLGSQTARALLRSGRYQPSIGLFPGRHFRKRKGDGCFHLRLHDGQAWLHWDAWDPRRFPIAHVLETPALRGGSLALIGLGIFFWSQRD